MNLKVINNTIAQFLIGLILMTMLSCQSLMAAAQIISKNINGASGAGNSFSPRSTPDGRYIVFASEAEDLVPTAPLQPQDNYFSDIYIYDTQKQIMEKISVGVNGQKSNGHSFYPSISDDGRYVIFQSKALNLVADVWYDETKATYFDYNNAGTYDVYLYDRQNKMTTRISNYNTPYVEPYVESNYWSNDRSAKISANGHSVIYISQFNDNLIQYDVATSKYSKLNIDGCDDPGNIGALNISSDARFISYSKGNNICVHDNSINKSRSVYTTPIGHTDSYLGYNGLNTHYSYSHPDISDDGRYIVFETYRKQTDDGRYGSYSINLDTIYLYDTTHKSLSIVYQNTLDHVWYIIYSQYNGFHKIMTLLNGASVVAPTISNDGRFIAYTGSNQHDIGDLNQTSDAFIYTISNGHSRRISHSLTGFAPNAAIYSVWLGGNTNQVLFVSSASNLSQNDINNRKDIFLVDVLAQEYQPQASKHSVSAGEKITVEFPYPETDNHALYYIGLQMPNLDIFLLNKNNELIPFKGDFPNDTLLSKSRVLTDILIDDSWASGTYQLLALKSSDSDQLLKTAIEINVVDTVQLKQHDLRGGCPLTCTLTPDLQYGIFMSPNADYVANDNNEKNDVFVCNTSTGYTERVSLNEQGQEFNTNTREESSISDNGRWIAFEYGDGWASSEIYLYDREKQKSTLLTQSIDIGFINNLVLSGNGQTIIFRFNGFPDAEKAEGTVLESEGLYVLDVNTQQVKFIHTDYIDSVAISYNGSIIVFSYKEELYLYENNSGNIAKLTQGSEILTDIYQTPSFTEDMITTPPFLVNETLVISKDAQVIVYEIIDKISKGDLTRTYLAVYDRATNTNSILKTAYGMAISDPVSRSVSLSDDGRFVLFASGHAYAMKNKHVKDAQGVYIYLFDRLTNQIELVASNIDSYDIIHHNGLKITGDGYSYRLGNDLFALQNRPIISKNTFVSGENLQISLPEQPKGYAQYFGLKTPDDQIFIYNSIGSPYLYNGDNLLAYQGERLILNELIGSSQWPPGKYEAYLLTFPATLTPSEYPDEWKLGTTPFEILSAQ